MSGEWLTDIIKDIHYIWLEVRLVDFVRPSFILIWLVIVFLPFGQTDRRDILAGMVYALFCAAAGVALIFALPQSFVPKPSFSTQLLGVATMLAIACMRWFYVANPNRERIVHSQPVKSQTKRG